MRDAGETRDNLEKEYQKKIDEALATLRTVLYWLLLVEID